MTGQNGESGWTPGAELLAAYADGELAEDGPAGALRKRVEAWLMAHPEAAGEVEVQRQLTEWCLATAAVDPAESAWEPLAARLRTLRLPQSVQRRRWSRLALLAALGMTGAACLWLALTLRSSLGRQNEVTGGQMATGNPQAATAPQDSETEVLPVATAAEVEILSVQGEDTSTLVAGELPVEGSLVLLQSDELTLTKVEPARDNMVPEIRRGGSVPMIWAPLDVEREDPEEPN